MKKIYLFAFISLIAISLVLAAQGSPGTTGAGTNAPTTTGSDSATQTGQGSGNGTQSNTETQTQNQGAGTQLQNQVQTREQVQQRVDEIKQSTQQRQQEMTQEMTSKSEKSQKVYQNQNQVKLAVHALLQMENLTGGIGPQVSQIAKEFDNSVKSTINAEEKIQTRSGFSRFFAGGDKKTADELEGEVTQNQARIQQLNQLKEQCNCTEEAKTMMQEQIQQMQQEQTRLQELAQKEKKSKGLLGWMWK